MPENATSIPLTLYGRSISSLPSLAYRSSCGPAGNGMPVDLPNLSIMFPMPTSMVSPNTRYLPPEYAITCVLPPAAYSRGGSLLPVTFLPISRCATQWFTPMRSTPNERDSPLAAVAAVLRHGPRPRPGGDPG